MSRQSIRHILIIIPVFISSFAVAQKSDTTQNQTIFGRDNVNVNANGYGGAQIGFSNLNNIGITLFTLEGGLVINKRFLVGAEFTGIYSTQITEVYWDRYDEEMDAVIRGLYAGLKIEPILKSQKVAHVNFPVSVGGGKLYYMTDRKYVDGSGDMKRKEVDSDVYFYFEPGVKLELNLSQKIRFGAVLSYRVAAGLDINSTPQDSFNVISLKIGLTFGKF